MFAVYRVDNDKEKPVGNADSLDGVITYAELGGVGRYIVYEAGSALLRWGSVSREQNATFILDPDRSRDWKGTLPRSFA